MINEEDLEELKVEKETLYKEFSELSEEEKKDYFFWMVDYINRQRDLIAQTTQSLESILLK